MVALYFARRGPGGAGHAQGGVDGGEMKNGARLNRSGNLVSKAFKVLLWLDLHGK